MAKQPTRRTLLFPMDLGSPAQYERSVFPLSRVRGKSRINQMDLYLEATLSEIFKMRDNIGNAENSKRLLRNAKKQYDDLMVDKEKIQQQRKSLNPVKQFSAYRSVRLLLEAGETLYTRTKTASEKLRRELLSIEVDREDVQSVTYDDLPSNARISGIAIPLDSESQPAEIAASYYDAAKKFVASQKETYGKDPFADEYAVENSPANAEPRRRSTSSSTMATSDGGAASSSSRLSGASGNNGFSFQNSKVARRSSI
ncbi:hypothetical protein C8R48DRAFT_410877 [Suillus tomentosus]|nr:hypothetical protein C8R48DRAFT_410877 [Suillus tomentosus]